MNMEKVKKGRIVEMAKEAEKRWNAKVLVVRTKVERGEAKPHEAMLEFEDVLTPGANQVGMMIFQNEKGATYIPLQQIIQIELEARPQRLVEVPQIVPVR